MSKMTEEQIYRLAKKRVQARKDFAIHLVVYLCVNALLICLWLFLSGRGFPWFLFPLGGWGIGLVAHYFTSRKLRGAVAGNHSAAIEREAEKIRAEL